MYSNSSSIFSYSPYSFNGMEKDNEVKGEGNSYDFGARMLDTRVGRWVSVDPLASKYPAISPYVTVGNMPTIAIDPNGKEIIIIGKDGKTYNYEPMMTNYTDSPQDVQDVIMGLNLMYNNVEGAKEKIDFLDGIQEGGIKLRLTENFGPVNKFYPPSNGDPTYGDLYFNPNQADVLNEKGDAQSPIVALAHELQHGFDYFKVYDDYDKAVTPAEIKIAEENVSKLYDSEYQEIKTTTQGLEPETAKYFNNGIRTEYTAPIEIRYVGCITCTSPLPPPTEKANNQINSTNESLKTQPKFK